MLPSFIDSSQTNQILKSPHPCSQHQWKPCPVGKTLESIPSKILLNTGVNNIDDQHPQDLVFNLRNLTEKFHRKFECQVFLSDVTPTEDYYEDNVHAVNQELTY